MVSCMNHEKIKLIVRNLELLVTALKKEITDSEQEGFKKIKTKYFDFDMESD